MAHSRSEKLWAAVRFFQGRRTSRKKGRLDTGALQTQVPHWGKEEGNEAEETGERPRGEDEKRV